MYGIQENWGAYHLAEKSGWGVESIMVSDLLGYRRVSHPLRFESIKGTNLCSVSLEPTRNREIGKWYATGLLVRTNRNERTTSKRTPQFSVGISEK